MTGVDDRTRIRIVIIGLVVVAFFGVLLARLWFLQVLSGDTFNAESQSNHVRIVWQQAPRGRILDDKGRVLVTNRTALAVGIAREDFPTTKSVRVALERRLAGMLNITPSRIEQRLADKRVSPFQPVVIATDVPLDAYLAINERADEFPGVQTFELAVRQYAQGTLAAQVLGYVNEITQPELKSMQGYRLGDEIGRTGIERQYEQYLRGTPELQKLEVDASGRVLRQLGGIDPAPGDDVQLTLDVDV
ncbi:MAG: penicillin-binding protein 2, partial [Actinobacteria bacterium]|nr:penicillin-binding protein 2 [Actinomycetota bacterium]